MKLIGIARLGKDAELNFTHGGKAVVNMHVAWNYGKPNEEGRKPSQWLELAFWGERAERMHKYLVKSTPIYLEADDVHIELFERKDLTTGYKLVGTVSNLEFTQK